MANPYIIDKQTIYIHFTSDPEDMNSGKYFKQSSFEDIAYFKNKFTKNKRHVLEIEPKNETTPHVKQGIIMWFLNREMYGTQTNSLVYKKQFNEEIKQGYQMAKNAFDAPLYERFLNKDLSVKFKKSNS